MNTTTQSTPAQIIARTLEDLDIQVPHSEKCIEEVRHWLANPGLDDPALQDLTALPFVTIDNPDSRDLDQALLVEHHDTGYRVRYALADASYYIRPGSELFAEALARGATFYTPTMAAAMLPVQLSEGLISLNPGEDRRALLFDMLVNSHGIVSRSTVHRVKIRSQAKLNYEGVQHWLDSNPACQQAFDESLLLFQELGQVLIEASSRRGVVTFDRTETRIQVSGEPPQFEATVRARHKTERYNEQISLLCNMQGAEMLMRLAGVTDAVQTVFRIHEAPLQKSIAELRSKISQFAQLQAAPDRWQWREPETLADYIERLPDEPEYTGRVRAIQRQIMHAQRASTFQPISGEHHALKADSYARFSSPMREVVGIFTHKELLEALGADGHNSAHDEALREAVIASANDARQRQRQLDKRIEFATLNRLFARDLADGDAQVLKGTVIGMRNDRLYITLKNMATTIKIYKDFLDEQFATSYTIGDVNATPADNMKPTWQLGQSVTVQLTGYDKARQHFLFLLSDAEH